MKCFITAAECLNFSRAAEQLFVTQPALSRQISSIEKKLCLELFIRKNHELALTPAAKYLLIEFKKICDDFDAAVINAHVIHSNISSILRIGICETINIDDILLKMLDSFTEKHAEVNIGLEYMNLDPLISGLYEESLDVAFTLQCTAEKKPNLVYKSLSNSRIYIAVSIKHPLAARDSVSFSELRDETFILQNPYSPNPGTARLLEYIKSQGFIPKIKQSPSLSASALMVQAGLGIAVFDSRSVFCSMKMIKLLDTDQFFNSDLAVVWNSTNKNPALQVFKNYV